MIIREILMNNSRVLLLPLSQFLELCLLIYICWEGLFWPGLARIGADIFWCWEINRRWGKKRILLIFRMDLVYFIGKILIFCCRFLKIDYLWISKEVTSKHLHKLYILAKNQFQHTDMYHPQLIFPFFNKII